MFQDLSNTGNAIIEQIIQLVYFMRGGVQYHDAFFISPFERQKLFDFIEKRLKDESQKMMPIY